MAHDIIRDSPFGRLVRLTLGNKWFPYEEERDDFDIDSRTCDDGLTLVKSNRFREDGTMIIDDDAKSDEKCMVVTWYRPDDPANPQNWSTGKKILSYSMVCLLTFAIYSGSSIITTGERALMKEYGVSYQVVLLVLSMYVLGYGCGPIVFSPISEIPVLGRNVPYVVSFVLFIIVTIAGATVRNFPGLVVCRFLQGFFGGPVLATGGASAGDIFPFTKLPYALSAWAAFAFGGPALGPVMSTYAVTEVTWRFAMYETLILSVITFTLMFFLLPETNPETILLWRAQRLRHVSGRKDLQSESEVKQASLRLVPLMIRTIGTPFKVTFLDPSIGFTNLYTALVYAIYYSWFESFPIVYGKIHGFSINQTSLTFIAVIIGGIIGCSSYATIIYLHYEKYTAKNGIGVQEHRLVPGLFASLLLPGAVFIFGWTARPEISWVIPTIGTVLFSGCSFYILQCVFLYLPTSYPHHAASIFTSNDFFRSALATGAIHFSVPLFDNLGVGRGNSILGGLLVGCAIAFFALYHYGPRLRARSKFVEQ